MKRTLKEKHQTEYSPKRQKASDKHPYMEWTWDKKTSCFFFIAEVKVDWFGSDGVRFCGSEERSCFSLMGGKLEFSEKLGVENLKFSIGFGFCWRFFTDNTMVNHDVSPFLSNHRTSKSKSHSFILLERWVFCALRILGMSGLRCQVATSFRGVMTGGSGVFP